MRPYETMVIFDTGADEAAVNGVLDRALTALKAKGGNPGVVGPSPTSCSTSVRATTSSSS